MRTICLIPVSFLFFSVIQLWGNRLEVDKIENDKVVYGRILSSISQKPVAKSHIFFVKGEIECFSDNYGNFKIGKGEGIDDIFLQIEHPDYVTRTLKPADIDKPIDIFLDPR